MDQTRAPAEPHGVPADIYSQSDLATLDVLAALVGDSHATGAGAGQFVYPAQTAPGDFVTDTQSDRWMSVRPELAVITPTVDFMPIGPSDIALLLASSRRKSRKRSNTGSGARGGQSRPAGTETEGSGSQASVLQLDAPRDAVSEEVAGGGDGVANSNERSVDSHVSDLAPPSKADYHHPISRPAEGVQNSNRESEAHGGILLAGEAIPNWSNNGRLARDESLAMFTMEALTRSSGEPPEAGPAAGTDSMSG